ncbi:MAG: V-type ATP synthase subunit F [Symbiobacteriaceae bacterium]|nr:V-type ATP synthase subunit F [Symbiobacteriaceae bacterium]
MRFYLLSDNADTCLGMRMAGMAGELITDVDTLHSALQRLGTNPDIAVIALTAGLIRLDPALITTWKLKRSQPLLVEVPDHLDSHDVSRNIADYIMNTIGVKL